MKGLIYAIAANLLWGLLPFFWKALKTVSVIEVMSHRIIWSVVFLFLLLAVQHQWGWLKKILKNPKIFFHSLLSACIILVSWVTYIWAINAGFLVEASLGYFISPLVSVLLGIVFLAERPRLWQWIGIFTAMAGVLYLTFAYGNFPWIALILALAFGLYSLLRKTATLDSSEGLFVETCILFMPAILYLFYIEFEGNASFGTNGLLINTLLISTGLATTLPLLFYVSAAKKISLSALGIIQYILPTMQFLLGVFIFQEPFNHSRLYGFMFVWFAILIYSAEAILFNKNKLKPPLAIVKPN